MSAPDRGASRAERGAPRRVALGVGALVVTLLALLFLRELSAARSTNAPGGLGGVKLGATLDEARGAQPGLDDARRFRAELHGEPASCTLVLGTDARVVRIECLIERAEAQTKLLHTLRELYGKESEALPDAWHWRNGRVSLSLAALPSLRLTSASAP